MLKIDNKRKGDITLGVGGLILVFGLNDVPDNVAQDNEKYLKALYEAGEITVVSHVEDDEEHDPFKDLPAAGPEVGDPVLDDEGNPTFDEDGNPILYISSEEQV